MLASKVTERLAGIPKEYLLALLNSTVFVASAITQNFFVVNNSLAWALFPNLIFFIASIIVWFWMMQRGWSLAPVCWFVLGSGLFFGFGVIAGGLHAHPWSAMVYGESTSHLLKVNLLNSISVFTVFLVTLAFANSNTQKNELHEDVRDFENRYKYPVLCLAYFSALIVFLRFYYFPDAENLIMRSVLAKAYFFLPSAFLFAGFVTRRIGFAFFVLMGVVLVQFIYGLVQLNKYEILMPAMALLVGSTIFTVSYRKTLVIVISMIIVFWLANPLIAISRLDYRYNPSSNTLLQRVEILKDGFNATYGTSGGLIKHITPEEGEQKRQVVLIDASTRMTFWDRFRAIGVRFDVASIQGYLLNEYDAGRAGKSLEDFWAVIIPRIVWPNKPVVTRFGTELNAQYYNAPAYASSSIAPTYDGEAYWNFGWTGVLFVSIYLGCFLGFFTQVALAARKRQDFGYFLVAYHMILPAVFVESWVASTYIGGLLTAAFYYCALRFIFVRALK